MFSLCRRIEYLTVSFFFLNCVTVVQFGLFDDEPF